MNCQLVASQSPRTNMIPPRTSKEPLEDDPQNSTPPDPTHRVKELLPAAIFGCRFGTGLMHNPTPREQFP